MPCLREKVNAQQQNPSLFIVCVKELDCSGGIPAALGYGGQSAGRVRNLIDVGTALRTGLNCKAVPTPSACTPNHIRPPPPDGPKVLGHTAKTIPAPKAREGEGNRRRLLEIERSLEPPQTFSSPHKGGGLKTFKDEIKPPQTTSNEIPKLLLLLCMPVPRDRVSFFPLPCSKSCQRE